MCQCNCNVPSYAEQSAGPTRVELGELGHVVDFIANDDPCIVAFVVLAHLLTRIYLAHLYS